MTDSAPGRRLGRRPAQPGRLAAPGRDALHRGPGDVGHGSRRPRSPTGGPSASGSSASIPSRRSPAARATAFRARHFEHDPAFGSTPSSSRPAASPARSRWSCRTAAPTACRSAGSGAFGCRSPTASATLSRVLDGRLCGRPVHPVPRRHQRHRDLRRRALPRGCREGRRSWCGAWSRRRRWALILDFNFAIQPSCAFDPRWACAARDIARREVRAAKSADVPPTARPGAGLTGPRERRYRAATRTPDPVGSPYRAGPCWAGYGGDPCGAVGTAGIRRPRAPLQRLAAHRRRTPAVVPGHPVRPPPADAVAGRARARARLRGGRSSPPSPELTELVAHRVAGDGASAEYGLATVDAELPEADRYLMALSAAVQMSGLAERIGMAQTT